MDQLLQIGGSIILASIPAFIWGIILYRKHPSNRKALNLAFITGGLAVFPILIYKFLWNFFPWMNAFTFAENYSQYQLVITSSLAIPLSVIITFMIVGFIEELMKMLAVKIVDPSFMDSIDDAIEIFIIAALGFSFVENILYFYSIWFTHGASELFIPFLFRSAFSTFAHLLFSGILGYFYGIAYFAKPILKEQILKNRHHWTVKLHKILSIKKEKLFHEQKIIEGLLISIGLHALFNIFLEIGLIWIILPFLAGGYHVLTKLLTAKENHKVYGLIHTKKG